MEPPLERLSHPRAQALRGLQQERPLQGRPVNAEALAVTRPPSAESLPLTNSAHLTPPADSHSFRSAVEADSKSCSSTRGRRAVPLSPSFKRGLGRIWNRTDVSFEDLSEAFRPVVRRGNQTLRKILEKLTGSGPGTGLTLRDVRVQSPQELKKYEEASRPTQAAHTSPVDAVTVDAIEAVKEGLLPDLGGSGGQHDVAKGHITPYSPIGAADVVQTDKTPWSHYATVVAPETSDAAGPKCITQLHETSTGLLTPDSMSVVQTPPGSAGAGSTWTDRPASVGSATKRRAPAEFDDSLPKDTGPDVRKRRSSRPISSTALTLRLDGGTPGKYTHIGKRCSVRVNSIVSRVSSTFSRRSTVRRSGSAHPCPTVPHPPAPDADTHIPDVRSGQLHSPSSTDLARKYARYFPNPPFVASVDEVQNLEVDSEAGGEVSGAVEELRDAFKSLDPEDKIESVLQYAIKKIPEHKRTAFVNTPDNLGVTALHIAAAYGLMKVCALLLRYGAKRVAYTQDNVSIPQFAKMAMKRTGENDTPLYTRIDLCRGRIRSGEGMPTPKPIRLPQPANSHRKPDTNAIMPTLRENPAAEGRGSYGPITCNRDFSARSSTIGSNWTDGRESISAEDLGTAPTPNFWQSQDRFTDSPAPMGPLATAAGMASEARDFASQAQALPARTRHVQPQLQQANEPFWQSTRTEPLDTFSSFANDPLYGVAIDRGFGMEDPLSVSDQRSPELDSSLQADVMAVGEMADASFYRSSFDADPFTLASTLSPDPANNCIRQDTAGWPYPVHPPDVQWRDHGMYASMTQVRSNQNQTQIQQQQGPARFMPAPTGQHLTQQGQIVSDLEQQHVAGQLNGMLDQRQPHWHPSGSTSYQAPPEVGEHGAWHARVMPISSSVSDLPQGPRMPSRRQHIAGSDLQWPTCIHGWPRNSL